MPRPWWGRSWVCVVVEICLHSLIASEEGRVLVKQTRKQLLELARLMLPSLVHEAVRVKVISMHNDISKVSGEELVIFITAEAPRFQ